MRRGILIGAVMFGALGLLQGLLLGANYWSIIVEISDDVQLPWLGLLGVMVLSRILAGAWAGWLITPTATASFGAGSGSLSFPEALRAAGLGFATAAVVGGVFAIGTIALLAPTTLWAYLLVPAVGIWMGAEAIVPAILTLIILRKSPSAA